VSWPVVALLLIPFVSVTHRSWRSSFFNYFYFTINIGALVGKTAAVGQAKPAASGNGSSTVTVTALILLMVPSATPRGDMPTPLKVYVPYPCAPKSRKDD
jgi:hypothetical protein